MARLALVSVLLGICQLCGVRGTDPEYCVSTDENTSRYYSSKTAYKTSRGKQVSSESVPGCQAMLFYMLTRHGTRFPGKDDMQKMRDVLPSIRDKILEHRNKGKLCDEDLEKLKTWKMKMKDNQDKILALAGWGELEQLALRNKGRYPHLLNQPYDSRHWIFQYTESNNRTRDSARAYAQGLFTSFDEVEMEVLKDKDDYLLRQYKQCDKWQKVHKKPAEEYDTFIHGWKVKQVTRRVTERLGLPVGTLDRDVIDVIYDACSYEYAIYDEAPWCAVFSQQDLGTLDYAEDLKSYWTRGYGEEVNYEMSCPLVTDLVKHFRSAKKGKGPIAVHRFGHTINVLTLLARLGLFKDSSPLRAKNYDLEHPKRWNTSLIGPFAANIAFAFYKCSDEYKVQVMVNEISQILPGCSEEVCPISKPFADWSEISRNCNLKRICRYTGSAVSHLQNWGATLIAAVSAAFLVVLS